MSLVIRFLWIYKGSFLGNRRTTKVTFKVGHMVVFLHKKIVKTELKAVKLQVQI